LVELQQELIEGQLNHPHYHDAQVEGEKTELNPENDVLRFRKSNRLNNLTLDWKRIPMEPEQVTEIRGYVEVPKSDWWVR